MEPTKDEQLHILANMLGMVLAKVGSVTVSVEDAAAYAFSGLEPDFRPDDQGNMVFFLTSNDGL